MIFIIGFFLFALGLMLDPEYNGFAVLVATVGVMLMVGSALTALYLAGMP